MEFTMAVHIYQTFAKERSDAVGMKAYYVKKCKEAQKRLDETEDEAEKKRIEKEVAEAEDDVADQVEKIRKAAQVLNWLEGLHLVAKVAE